MELGIVISVVSAWDCRSGIWGASPVSDKRDVSGFYADQLFLYLQSHPVSDCFARSVRYVYKVAYEKTKAVRLHLLCGILHDGSLSDS